MGNKSVGQVRPDNAHQIRGETTGSAVDGETQVLENDDACYDLGAQSQSRCSSHGITVGLV